MIESMRLRNIPGSRDRIAESEYVVHDYEKAKGHWSSLFGNDHPIRLEIGTGKGQFLYTLALQNPEINYIGIEKFSSVLLRVIEKQEENPLPNLKLIRMDAEYITDVFDKEEIDRIYLNFSDPWPKDRHAKRRLPSGHYLQKYETFLKRDGILEFKTDNRGLFDFSLEEAPAAGWKIVACTYDLHHDPTMNEGNIMTEYEEKFSALGNPIFKAIYSKDRSEIR